MRYVALLRGVNVGGSKMIGMKELKAVFEAAGMTSVRTYINSGNVIFDSEVDRAALAPLLEEAIAAHFGHDVGVLLRDLGEMRAVVAAIPADWTNDERMRCDVVFLWPEIDDPAVLERFPTRPELEDVIYMPGAVVRRIDRKDAGKSGLVRVMGTPVYKQMTVRNCNTPRKLLELMEA